MTLLHQAAQKAVEALTTLVQEYAADCEAVALEKHCFPGDSWKNKQTVADATLARLRENLESALQHQEEPREPVAWLNPSSGKTCSADEKFSMENHQGMPGKAVAAHFSDPLYASPSTTRPEGELISDERILRLWDTHVGDPCAKYPLGDFDKLEFARAVLRAAVLAPSTTRQQEVGSDAAMRDLLTRLTSATSISQFHGLLCEAKELLAAAPSTPEKAGGVAPTAPATGDVVGWKGERHTSGVTATTPAQPLNGVAATVYHDEGAYAQCGACGRYTLDPMALSARPRACECGEKLGWCGSFKKPGPNAKWSNHFTPADGVPAFHITKEPGPAGTSRFRVGPPLNAVYGDEGGPAT